MRLCCKKGSRQKDNLTFRPNEFRHSESTPIQGQDMLTIVL